MKTKLRKTFYIGLGGTGMNAILRTKKMFMDNYGGHVPPMIGFLGIDTDEGAYDETKNPLKTRDGKIVTLDKFEQCKISVKNPTDYYTAQRRRLSWLPENNVRYILNLDKGAGQIRTNGRLALINNMENVKNAIGNVFTLISSDTIIDNPEYELLPGNVVDVHIVFSVGGGTGCGTFIDLAYLLKSMYNSGTRGVNVCGYGVLPNVFHEMVKGGNAMKNTKPNAFGAIQDLDFLMHLSLNDKPVHFDWMSTSYDANTPPYDAFFFVDNKNDGGVVYDNVNKLTEMISLALVSAAGQIGAETASIANNVEKCMIEGDLDVQNKKAWVSCIGASQIIFKGSELADVYSILAKQRIIQRLLMGCQSGDIEANRWIDLPEVNIRENEGQDNVINYLCSNVVKDFDIDRKDASSPESIIDEFAKRTLESSSKEATANQHALLDRVKEQLTMEVKNLLQKGDCGVTLTIDTLMGITRQIGLFVNEMTQEKENFESELSNLDGKQRIAVEELKRYASKTFKTGGGIDDRTEEVKAAVKRLLSAKIEITRRTLAIQFYNGILANVDSEYQRVNNIKSLLKKQLEEISEDLSQKRNNQGAASNTVEVDLSVESWDLLDVKDDVLVMSEFIDCLPSHDLYNMTDSSQLVEGLDTYTKRLSGYKQWEGKTIDDIINEKTEEQFDQIVKRAMQKALPFMKINSHGEVATSSQLDLSQAINRYYFVCLPDAKNSRFTKDDKFKKMNESALNVSFTSTGLKDRIIIYRQDGTIPAFAIDGVELYEREGARTEIVFNFDANIVDRMKGEHYQMLPKKSSDDALALWVNGFIFGLIKYDDTKKTYFYYDEKNGDPLDDFWYNTGEHYRDQAFNFFDRNLKSIQEDFEQAMDDKINNMGKDAYKNLISDVRQNYVEKYSQVPVKLIKDTRNQAQVKELMQREVTYVKKELGK